MLEEGLSFLAAAHNKNRLKDELQKMQYLYNDHISGVKIEVQKLYSIKVTIIITLIIIIVISISIITIIMGIIIISRITIISIIFRKRSWTR